MNAFSGTKISSAIVVGGWSVKDFIFALHKAEETNVSVFPPSCDII